MNKNCLSNLLGQYMSDSDNEDDNSSKIVTEVDLLLDEIGSKNGNCRQPTTYWTQCMDPNTGHPYYWNIETKDVTWEKPLEYENYVKHMTSMSTKLPEECWIKGYSEDTKTPYYVNEYTRVVSWEKPLEYKEKPVKERTKVVPKKVSREKRQKPVKKPRPKHLDNHSEDEKIELISTYTCKSESSSDESHVKVEKKVTEKKSKSKIKLVAAYSTDSESDTNDQNDVSTSTENIKPIVPVENPPLPAETPPLPEDILPPPEPSSERSESLSPILNIETNSFASIITGGKTDNIMDEELNKFKEELEKDLQMLEQEEVTKINEVTETSFDEKTFQRKRRIEIRPKITETEVRLGLGYTENSNNTNDTTNTKTKNKYINFQKSHVEFTKDSNGTEENSTQAATECDSKVIVDNKSSACLNKTEIEDLCDVIGDKVKFLSVGKPEVSAVQVISIQLETLLAAFRSSHLDAEYFFKWLKSTSDDLATLEQNAAPDGWECKWDRENSQYCYKNLTTNEVQWEFPKDNSPEKEEVIPDVQDTTTTTDGIKGEDEMDISTTPPPNEHEQILANSNSRVWDVDNNPPPPLKISIQPLPPGIDRTDALSSTKDISCELASFYSDLATLDPAVVVVANAVDTEIKNSTSDKHDKIKIKRSSADDNPEKKKRKKIKVQGLGSKMKEVSTMVANWQKAQKELGS